MKRFTVEFKDRYEEGSTLVEVEAKSEVDAVGLVFDHHSDGDNDEVVILKVKQIEE